MAGSNYEVYVLRKEKWTVESQERDKGAAIAFANTLAADRRNDGVKVVEEIYDEETGVFREKTVFSYYNQEDKVLASSKTGKNRTGSKSPNKSSRKRVANGKDGTSQKFEPRSVMLALALVFGLSGNLIFVVLWGEKLDLNLDILTKRIAPAKETTIYDLPEISANIRSGDEERVLHIKVGVKLKNKDQNLEIERNLTAIVNRMAGDIRRMETLDRGLNMQELQKNLTNSVRSAGQTEIDGLLLKEVTIF